MNLNNKKIILPILLISILSITCVIFVNYNRKKNVSMEGESETGKRMWYYGTSDNVIDKSIESIINSKKIP